MATPNQGISVSLSADGNTLAVGGYENNSSEGAAWIFVRNNNSWTQQGSPLVGSGATGGATQGISVSLSADGNTLAVGGFLDNSTVGATWIFTRSSSTWAQVGSKLVGSGVVGGAARQGSSVSLSADAKTLAVGGYADNSNVGATWIFQQNNDGSWSQMGEKLVGYGYEGQSYQGYSVSLNAAGNTLAIGGPDDGKTFTGAAWIFCRINDVWYQMGSKLLGLGLATDDFFGNSVAFDAKGDTLVISAPFGALTAKGKTFVFV